MSFQAIVLILNIIIVTILYSYFMLDDRFNLNWIKQHQEEKAIMLMMATAYYSVAGFIVWLI